MKRTIKFIAVFLILVVAGFAYAHRVITVNQTVKDAPVTRHEMETEVPFGDNILADITMKGYSVTVNRT